MIQSSRGGRICQDQEVKSQVNNLEGYKIENNNQCCFGVVDCEEEWTRYF